MKRIVNLTLLTLLMMGSVTAVAEEQETITEQESSWKKSMRIAGNLVKIGAGITVLQCWRMHKKKKFEKSTKLKHFIAAQVVEKTSGLAGLYLVWDGITGLYYGNPNTTSENQMDQSNNQ